MATARQSTRRRKAPVRWAIVALSCVATIGAYRAIVTGPPPAHAAPPPTQAVVQPAPTLNEMIGQIQGQVSGDGTGTTGTGASPTFRTRGS